MSLLGDWDVTIKTPIGSLAVDYNFTDTDDGIAGTATYQDDTVPLQNITVDGDRVTWQQKVTKPMRLNLSFDVIVTDDALTGHSRAGRLPRSTVVGQRHR